jgi:hypothetical protein
MTDINFPFTEWLCEQCDDTECRFSVNADLHVICPVRCPLDSWAVNPNSMFERTSYIDQQTQKEQWCGDCGFKNSKDCDDITTWKRCRLMNSPPEFQNIENRLDLARQSTLERVLNDLEQSLREYENVRFVDVMCEIDKLRKRSDKHGISEV